MANKMKSHRGACKRFKLTGSGKVKRNKAYKSHILTKKSQKRKRGLRQSTTLTSADHGRIKEVGEKTAVCEMRSVMPQYIKGFPGASRMKVALCRASTETEVRQILDDCLRLREDGL